jgi:thiosulfate/3-mercaptopyruvate sulfurtransferase
MGHELGLTEDDNIIVYDGLNIFSSCRVYWTFKYFGHKNIAVLNGVQIYSIRRGCRCTR